MFGDVWTSAEIYNMSFSDITRQMRSFMGLENLKATYSSASLTGDNRLSRCHSSLDFFSHM